MRPPFIEAAALLAAHGHAFQPLSQHRRTRMPTQPDGEAFPIALYTDQKGKKPIGFTDLDALAKHIQRERGPLALDMKAIEDLEIQGQTEPRPGVTILRLDHDGNLDKLIGHAWIDGRPIEALQAAVRRNRLVVHVEDEAA